MRPGCGCNTAARQATKDHAPFRAAILFGDGAGAARELHFSDRRRPKLTELTRSAFAGAGDETGIRGRLRRSDRLPIGLRDSSGGPIRLARSHGFHPDTSPLVKTNSGLMLGALCA